MTKKIIIALGALGLLGAAALIPIGGGPLDVERGAGTPGDTPGAAPGATMDLSAFSDGAPGRPLRLLFIHHSCGGQLLAEPGPEDGEACIYRSHPNGGGLRHALERAGYLVHEASYGSRVGEATDIFDWPAKFQTQMDAILACDHQDTPHPAGVRNDIVAFKSCFPNSDFGGPGQPPGDPAGPELTVANAQAAYRALLPEMGRHPEVLFLAVTAPPLVDRRRPEPVWKLVARRLLGRPSYAPNPASGALARRFNDWLKAPDGWLAGYAARNVVVFDYFDVLTDHGAADFARYGSDDGYDSHPSREGNTRAAAELAPLLNRAVRRAGLAD